MNEKHKKLDFMTVKEALTYQASHSAEGMEKDKCKVVYQSSADRMRLIHKCKVVHSFYIDSNGGGYGCSISFL